jgi:hypothetical protein
MAETVNPLLSFRSGENEFCSHADLVLIAFVIAEYLFETSNGSRHHQRCAGRCYDNDNDSNMPVAICFGWPRRRSLAVCHPNYSITARLSQL